MPIEFHSLQQGMGRVWLCRGVLTGRDLIANNERILSSKSYEGVRWLIIDETETTMDISTEEIRAIRRQDDRLAAVLPRAGHSRGCALRRWLRNDAYVGDSDRASRMVHTRLPR